MLDPNLEIIIALALEKQSLIEDFLKLTEEQAESIKNDNFDSILNSINKKQNIVEQVNILDLKLQGNWADDNESLKSIMEKTRNLMARAIAIDDNNIMLLKYHQAEIFEKLKNAKTNKTTHTLYRGKNLNIEGILLDKKK